MRYKKKESELNHPNFVAVRLSDAELHLLDQSASTLVISRSEYLRKVLTEKEIQNRIEIKSHHYIISFDPADGSECGLTGKKAQALCLELAKKIFPGYKHRFTDKFLKYFKQEVMNMCHREGLHQIDLLQPAEIKITQAEYMAKQSSQDQLEKINQKIIEDGLTPTATVFQTQKQHLRNVIDECAALSYSFEDFQSRHLEQTFLQKDPMAVLYARYDNGRPGFFFLKV